MKLLLVAGVALVAAPRAQVGGEGIVAYRQALLDASVDTRVVVVATHPDDPYRGLCLLLRRKWGCDVTVLVATRGEGGQNAVGPELGRELAAIRTRETIAAARRLDVRVRFLDLPDFGYSRTAAEALDRWRQQRPLERLTAALRELDPDLVITPHGVDEAHGQKRAVFHLLRKSLGGGDLRARFFRKASAGAADLELELDRLDPELGVTYQELAFAALLEHRTQAPHKPMREAIEAKIRLRHEGPGSGRLFDGVRGLWERTAELGKHLGPGGAARVADAAKLLESLPQIPTDPDLRKREDPTALCLRLLPVVQRLRAAATRGSDAWRRLDWRVRALERAVLIGSVVRCSWGGPEEWPADQDRLAVPLRVWNDGRTDVRVRVSGLDPATATGFVLIGPNGRAVDEPVELVVPHDHRRDTELFLTRAAGESNASDVDLALDVEVIVRGVAVAAGVSRRVKRLPALAIVPEPESEFLVSERGGTIRLSLLFRKTAGLALKGVLAMSAPVGVALLPESDRETRPIRVDLRRGTTEHKLAVRLRVPPWASRVGEASPRFLRLYLEVPSGQALPASAECHIRLDPVRIRVPDGLRIAIVRGPDRTVEEALSALGLEVEVLEPRSLARAELDRFDTILIDSRALLLRGDELRAQVPRFLAYARRGHHLVVLYHKPQEFNEADTGVLLAPYPLVLGAERVTREDAPVRVRLPKHWLMARPNRLAARDWDGWVQERGLYFPKAGAFDERYETPLEIEELPMVELAGVETAERRLRFEPQSGSLLAATVGDGSYVYCALVIHRQLRAFHPGAARLLVNLVTPARWPLTRMR